MILKEKVEGFRALETWIFRGGLGDSSCKIKEENDSGTY